MPLKIIGVGFGRTGTESLYTALNQLGLPCYHMYEVLNNKLNKSHLDFWLKVSRAAPGTSFEWEREVFSRYQAAVDKVAEAVGAKAIQRVDELLGVAVHFLEGCLVKDEGFNVTKRHKSAVGCVALADLIDVAKSK